MQEIILFDSGATRGNVGSFGSATESPHRRQTPAPLFMQDDSTRGSGLDD